MKIWAKVLKGDKILRDTIYEGEHAFTPNGFRGAVQNAAYLLDVSTPVLLPAHFRHFDEFKRVKFLPTDFVEEVEFTAFVLELVKEERPKAVFYEAGKRR